MVKSLRLIMSPAPDWPATRVWYQEVLGLEQTDGWDNDEADRGAFFGAGTAEIEVME